MTLLYPAFGGVVRKYSGNGRTLGYPTANIKAPREVPDALYLGYTTAQGERLPSIIYVGAPETFHETIRRAESHILDFPDKDLYEEYITLEIVHKLRDNMKFPSGAALKTQMQQDEKDAREYFANPAE